MQPLTTTSQFINTNTNTCTFAYPKDAESIERHSHFMPEEIEESDGYIVSYPYGNQDAPIVAIIKNNHVYLTIDRDCYEIEMQFIHFVVMELVGKIAEIYFDTEDVTLVRECLVKYHNQKQNQIKFI